MPRKRPINRQTTPHLREVMREGYSSLLTVRSIFGGYFKQDEKVMLTIEQLVEDYNSFTGQAEHAFAEKIGRK